MTARKNATHRPSCASSSLRPTPSRFTARSAAGRRNDARVLVETDQSLCPSWPAGARPVARGRRPPSLSWRWISARYQRRKALTRGSGGGTASSPAALSRSAASSRWVRATLVRTLSRPPHVHVGGRQAAAGRRRQLAGDDVAQRHVVGGMLGEITELMLQDGETGGSEDLPSAVDRGGGRGQQRERELAHRLLDVRPGGGEHAQWYGG